MIELTVDEFIKITNPHQIAARRLVKLSGDPFATFNVREIGVHVIDANSGDFFLWRKYAWLVYVDKSKFE